MALFINAIGECLATKSELSPSEIYVHGMPIAFVYSLLQLWSIDLLWNDNGLFLIILSTVEWPIILPIYLYAIYLHKIKRKRIYLFNIPVNAR